MDYGENLSVVDVFVFFCFDLIALQISYVHFEHMAWGYIIYVRCIYIYIYIVETGEYSGVWKIKKIVYTSIVVWREEGTPGNWAEAQEIKGKMGIIQHAL